MRRVLGVLAVTTTAMGIFGQGAVAGAPGPESGVTYGGGRIDRKFVRGGLLSAPVTIRVAKDGRSLNLYAGPNEFCDGKIEGLRAFYKDIAVSARISRRGTFRGKRTFDTPFRARPSKGSIEFEGRFDGPGTARGTLRLRQTVPSDEGRETTCDTRTVRWRTYHPNVQPVRGQAPKGGAFYGLTTQKGEVGGEDTRLFRSRFPLVIRVSPGGAHVESAVWAWAAKCRNGGPINFDVNFSPRGNLNRNGTFSIPERFARDISGGLERETVSVSFKGDLGRAFGAGTIRMRTVVTNKESGEVSDRCDSGLVRWRIHRMR